MTQELLSISSQESRVRGSTRRAAQKLALSKRMFVDVAFAIDVLLVTGSAFLIKYLYVADSLGDSGGTNAAGPRISYLTVITLVTLTLFAALLRRRHYAFDNFENLHFEREFVRLVFAVLFSFGLALFAVFMLKESTHFSRVWVVAWCVTSFTILFAGKVLWSLQFRALSAKGYFRRRVTLLGGGEALDRTRDCLLSAYSHVKLVSVIEIDLPSCSPQADDDLLEVAVDRVILKGQAGGVDEVIVALPSSESALLDHIVRRLKLLPAELKVALDLGSSNYGFVDIGRIGSTNFASIQTKPISEWNRALKICEDYILASLFSLIFLPPMVLIAIAIKLDSKGPVLFRQNRHGSNHKIIRVLKFRTMTVMEDGDKVTQASKNDKRVTRVGRFLRKSSLDELPQLFNVLRGDMSIVGPRPLAIAHNNKYSLMLESYASRHRVKPGMTGWAQVNGLRGEIDGEDLLQERVRYDLEYIDEWSIWFDLQILFMTPFYGFVSKRAY